MNNEKPFDHTPHFDFSHALGLAQNAHDVGAATDGNVFTLLRLDSAAVGRDLRSSALTPADAPGYSSVPLWKPWQDF